MTLLKKGPPMPLIIFGWGIFLLFTHYHKPIIYVNIYFTVLLVWLLIAIRAHFGGKK